MCELRYTHCPGLLSLPMLVPVMTTSSPPSVFSPALAAGPCTEVIAGTPSQSARVRWRHAPGPGMMSPARHRRVEILEKSESERELELDGSANCALSLTPPLTTRVEILRSGCGLLLPAPKSPTLADSESSSAVVAVREGLKRELELGAGTDAAARKRRR